MHRGARTLSNSPEELRAGAEHDRGALTPHVEGSDPLFFSRGAAEEDDIWTDEGSDPSDVIPAKAGIYILKSQGA